MLEHLLLLQRVPESVELGQLRLVRPYVHLDTVRELQLPPEPHPSPFEYYTLEVQRRRWDL